jgi:hypothetical protein
MVGQGGVLVENTEEEIARAVEVEIARSERPTRNANKEVGKKHTSPRDRHGGIVNSDDNVGDGATVGGVYFPRWHPTLMKSRSWARELSALGGG